MQGVPKTSLGPDRSPYRYHRVTPRNSGPYNLNYRLIRIIISGPFGQIVHDSLRIFRLEFDRIDRPTWIRIVRGLL